MSGSILIGLIVLSLTTGGWKSVLATNQPGLCSYTTSFVEYYPVYRSDRTTVYTVCGIWDCCRCAKSRYRSVLETRSRVVYRTAHRCCRGYRLASDNHCEPICNPSCENGGTCIAPNTCSCAPGTIGTHCETPTCVLGCANGGTCTAPNTCTCAIGWTGNTCRTRVEQLFVMRGASYANGSTILLSDIGEGNNALICTTTQTNCCGIGPNGEVDYSNRRGDFYYPDGTQVPVRSTTRSDGLFRGRGYQMIKLYHLSSATSTPPTGWYRCDIPNENGDSHNIFINIVLELPTTEPPITTVTEITTTTEVTTRMQPVSQPPRPPEPDEEPGGHLELAQLQIVLSGAENCQEWKANTGVPIVRHMSKLIVEKLQEMSQVNITFNDILDVSLRCIKSP